jgi:hypothetical protein
MNHQTFIGITFIEKGRGGDMKKFTVIGLVGFLVLSFGTTVYAQKVEFKASGFIDAVYWLTNNVPYAYDIPNWQPFNAWLPPIYGPSPLFNPQAPNFGPALDKNRSAWETRARLKLDAVVSKELSGTVFLEADSGEWGEVGAGGRNYSGKWSADQASVEVKNLYFDFGVPVIPFRTTLRVGIQPFSVRPHMVVYNDGAGITAGIQIDPVTIQPLWFKPVENQDYAADDLDIYGLNVTAKMGKLSFGGFGLYYNQNTYPIPGAVSSTVNFRSEMWWLGLYADGRLGPVDTNFDVVMDTGEVEDHRDIPVRAPDVKYRGWATRLKIDYPWEKFNFGVVGMYASGSDQKKTDGGVSTVATGGLPGNTTPFGTPTRKVSGYVVPTASEQFGFGESLILTGYPVWNGFMGYNVLNYGQMHRGSIGGTWVGRLYGSYKAAPWYKLTLAGIYIGDTTKNGNTMGNARKSNGLPRDDNAIGFEVDVINEINIYKNLKWDIGLGYLFAGKALDYFDTRVGRNISGDDPWAVVTRLVYTF